MAWNVTILHNSSCIVVVNEIPFLSLTALQSLNSHYSFRIRPQHSLKAAIYNFRSVSHTKSVLYKPNGMAWLMWKGYSANKEEIWRNTWELGNDVFRWLERLGWATNINNVCGGAPKHELEFAAVLFVLNHLDETIPKRWLCEWDHWQADFPPLAWGCFLHLMFSDKV